MIHPTEIIRNDGQEFKKYRFEYEHPRILPNEFTGADEHLWLAEWAKEHADTDNYPTLSYTVRFREIRFGEVHKEGIGVKSRLASTSEEDVEYKLAEDLRANIRRKGRGKGTTGTDGSPIWFVQHSEIKVSHLLHSPE